MSVIQFPQAKAVKELDELLDQISGKPRSLKKIQTLVFTVLFVLTCAIVYFDWRLDIILEATKSQPQKTGRMPANDDLPSIEVILL